MSKVVIVLTGCFLMTGCSFVIRVDVINKTDHEIKVSYSYTSKSYCDRPTILRRANGDSSEQIESSARIKSRGVGEDKTDGFVNCGFSMKVKAGEVARLRSLNDREFRDKTSEEVFGFKELLIDTSEGVIVARRERVLKLFQKIKPSAFSFGPKIPSYEFVVD